MLNIFRKKEPGQENAEKNKETANLSTKGRKLNGLVVSNKMKKTVVVAVSHAKKHPKYQKYFTITRKLKAHDENNRYQIGDKVVIQETRPMSREKRWVVVNKIL